MHGRALLTSTQTPSTNCSTAGGRNPSSNNYGAETLSMYNSTDLPPHIVGVRPPSTSSLTPSRAELAHSSTTSGQDNSSLPHVASECAGVP